MVGNRIDSESYCKSRESSALVGIRLFDLEVDFQSILGVEFWLGANFFFLEGVKLNFFLK